MDKKELTQQEGSNLLFEAPLTPPPAPAPEPDEDMPVIEPLSFCEESPATEECLPVPPETEAEPLPEPEVPPLSEDVPVIRDPDEEGQPSHTNFMDRIPNVDEDPPADTSRLSEVEVSAEILPDSQAMHSHGMLDPAEEVPFFDMRILEDPDLTIPEPEPVEEVPDQEYRDSGKEFDAMFHAPAPKKKTPEPPRQASKGRPKRKKGEGLLGIPNILVTVVWLVLIVSIGVTAGRMLWVCAADVLAFGREDKPVTITIYEADTMDDIIDKLHANGLIRYKSLFQFYADISDAEEDIKPGIYDLNTRYDYHALVNFMSPRSSREVITLTIPEGYTCTQIFHLLEENRICTALDIAAYAANGELDEYWFLEGVARGSENCLEGYLFPDTYEFYKNSTPREALQKMLNNFDYRFDADMRAQIDNLNDSLTGNYTIREIAIVASLIEKESAAPSESPKIAGVIYNRLFNWGSNPAYLNIDASIVYAQGGDTEHIDTGLDSPYNTYTNTGLTPGPIANPGLSSLKAALNPESHNYYYYVLNPATGMHQFSTTYDEHTGYVRSFAEAQ